MDKHQDQNESTFRPGLLDEEFPEEIEFRALTDGLGIHHQKNPLSEKKLQTRGSKGREPRLRRADQLSQGQDVTKGLSKKENSLQSSDREPQSPLSQSQPRLQTGPRPKFSARSAPPPRVPKSFQKSEFQNASTQVFSSGLGAGPNAASTGFSGGSYPQAYIPDEAADLDTSPENWLDQDEAFSSVFTRVSAFLFDSLFCLVMIGGMLTWGISESVSNLNTISESILVDYRMPAVLFSLIFSYFWLSEALTGRTLGQFVHGLRVVSEKDLDSKRPGLFRSLWRQLQFWLGFACFFIGPFISLTNHHRKAWHDWASSTLVIKNEYFQQNHSS